MSETEAGGPEGKAPESVTDQATVHPEEKFTTSETGLQVQMVPFHEDQIEAVQTSDGTIYALPKRICENIGVNWKTQFRKLQRDPIWGMVMMTIPSQGGHQETCAIPISKVAFWVSGIQENKVSPEVREKMRLYREECEDVLGRHFKGGAGQNSIERLAKVEPVGSSPFDEIRRFDENGVEYWDARQMMPKMGYSNWEHFKGPIRKAELSAKAHDFEVERLFTRIRDFKDVDQKGGRPRENIRLTRRACYLVAMNCDPAKVEVAAAQNYFAEKTREAEVSSDALVKTIDRVVNVLEAQQVTLGEHAMMIQKVDKTVSEFVSDISTINGRITKIETMVGKVVPVANQADEPYLTIHGYCQDRGIKTNRETNRQHTRRLKLIIERDHLDIVPRLIRIRGSEWPLYHWPVSFLDRYFSHEKNRDLAMRNRRIFLFGKPLDRTQATK